MHSVLHLTDGASHHDSVHDITTTGADTSQISVFSDEGLDLSQRISESMFVGPDLEPDSEEVIYGKTTLLWIKHGQSMIGLKLVTASEIHRAAKCP